MFRKIVVFILISTALFSHKIQGIKLEAEKIKNDSILIKAYFQKSKKQLVGNKVKLISKIDNRRLNQTYIKEGKNT
ncbi:MAG: hypothetical protein OIF32_06620, partial [Campylobacterales bacterium]|nr:hypothetical protein [Campylobacterales bacterium]